MAVWWGSPLHTMDISDKDAQDMEKALRDIGEAKFGKVNMYIDKVQIAPIRPSTFFVSTNPPPPLRFTSLALISLVSGSCPVSPAV